MTDQTTTNPFSLAQYLVAEPADLKKFYNFLDADPTLQQLRTRLQVFMMQQVEDGSFHKSMALLEHPNSMLKRLAERADEFCPGRSQSDLLYKLIAVHEIFDLTMRGIAAAYAKSNISMSMRFDISMIDSLMEEMAKIRSTSKL